MAQRHKYAGATAKISTTLDANRIATIAEEAAKGAETIQALVRLEESQPGRLVYSVRNRMLGGRVEFMTFHVTLKEDSGVRKIATQILTYKQKRQWLIVVPLPWQMIAWGNYKSFMHGLVKGIKSADPSASGTITELVPV